MRGWKMRRCAPEVRPRRTFPERCSAAEPCPGSSTTMRRAAARDCLKTRRKRASRGVLRWTPDTLPLRSRVPGTCRGAALWVPGTCRGAALWVPGACRGAALWDSGDVPRGGTLGSAVCFLRLKIPALRCAAAGMTGVGELRSGWEVGRGFANSPEWSDDGGAGWKAVADSRRTRRFALTGFAKRGKPRNRARH